MKKSVMKKAAALFTASALMCGVCAAPAFAADAIEKTGTSEVTVTKAEVGQISVTVPQQIPLAAGQDGKFLVPDASKTKIVNASNFPVKVSKVQATVIDNKVADLVARNGDLSMAEGATAWKMWMTVASGSDTMDLSSCTTAPTAVTTPAQWEMAAGNGEINLGVAGAMSADVVAEVAGVHALDIVWTVAV